MFWGCITAPSSNSNYIPPQYVAIFDYSPPSQVAAQKSSVTYTVGKVTYENLAKKDLLKAPQFANLEKAIAKDLSGILTARGFSIRGPYDSYDLVPYADKKAIDFFLDPVVTTIVMLPEDPNQESPINVTVKMRFDMREINTRELMWSKNLTFSEFKVPLLSVVESYTRERGKIVSATFAPDQLENLIAKEMEKQYPVLMGTIYTLIDQEEMAIIKKQAQEVKKLKGY
jgi:hypothetical protein